MTASRPNGPASRARIALALVLDYLLFATVFSLLVWPVRTIGGSVSPWITSQLTRLGAFVVVWIATVAFTGTSPGALVLGLRRGPEGWRLERAPAREACWTLGAGLAMVWASHSSATHLADGLPPPPVLGQVLPPWGAFAAIFAHAALGVAAGVQMMRGDGRAALVALVLVVLEGASLVIDETATDAWVREQVVARRPLQGIPVRAGEIEFMQAATLTMAKVGAGIGGAWMIAAAGRLGLAGEPR